MEHVIFDKVKHTEDSVNKFAADVCAELSLQRNWLHRMYNPNDTSRFAEYKQNILNSNERLIELYLDSIEQNKEFSNFYEETLSNAGTDYVCTTPLPFIYMYLNGDYKKIKNHLESMREAADFTDVPVKETLDAYKHWLKLNLYVFQMFLAKRYTRYFHVYSLEWF